MAQQLQDVQILRSVRKDQCIKQLEEKQLTEDIKKLKLQVNKIEEELRRRQGRRCRDEFSETPDDVVNQHPHKKVALETSSSTSISSLVACTGTTSTLISSAAAATPRSVAASCSSSAAVPAVAAGEGPHRHDAPSRNWIAPMVTATTRDAPPSLCPLPPPSQIECALQDLGHVDESVHVQPAQAICEQYLL